MLEKDRIVVSFDAAGDIRGLVTVTIDRDAKGALSGEWAVDALLRLIPNVGTPPEARINGDRHRDGEGSARHERTQITQCTFLGAWPGPGPPCACSRVRNSTIAASRR